MASIVNTVLAQANENLTSNAQNVTGRPPSTPEGMAVAYGSLVIMALLPIFFGSYRSVVYHKEKVCSSCRIVNRYLLLIRIKCSFYVITLSET